MTLSESAYIPILIFFVLISAGVSIVTAVIGVTIYVAYYLKKRVAARSDSSDAAGQ